MIDFEKLERQLQVRTHGLARRRAILERARGRISAAAGKLRREAEAAIREAEAVEAKMVRVEELATTYGCLRRTKASESDDEVMVLDRGSVDLEVMDASRTAGSGSELVLDLATARGAGELPPFEWGGATPSIVGHDDRALYIPGYAHLALLAQTQWMSVAKLDEAAERAIARGVVGEALADDLVGRAVHGRAALQNAEADAFCEGLRKRRAGAHGVAGDE